MFGAPLMGWSIEISFGLRQTLGLLALAIACSGLLASAIDPTSRNDKVIRPFGLHAKVPERMTQWPLVSHLSTVFTLAASAGLDGHESGRRHYASLWRRS
jgi:hypothetical protein